MPRGWKQEAVFTLLMVGMMVLGMKVYNVVLHGGLGPDFLGRIAAGIGASFLVALGLTVAFVNRTAKALARRMPIDKDSRWQVIVTTSCLMMAMMVTLMSAYATARNTGVNAQFLPAWGAAVSRNVLAALPLQLLVVGPACRRILAAIQARS
jgi:hypothetical protein